VQTGYLGDIVLRVESLMEATKGGVSSMQIAGRCRHAGRRGCSLLFSACPVHSRRSMNPRCRRSGQRVAKGVGDRTTEGFRPER
jgi:hypothetical protein